MDLLIYEGKVAVALLIFYLFYRFLLRKETFHRFNRVVLVGTAVLSFLLPLCIITVHRPMEAVPLTAEAMVLEPMVGEASEMAPVVAQATHWWQIALTVVFWAGVAFVVVRVLVSILSIAKLIRQADPVREEDGCRIVVTDRDIDPFSWMKYIVLSREDWEAPHASIIAHEKAHIGLGHSVDILLVDVLSAFQWFNPAIWMLRADLKELHEYEADDAVLRAGTNIKEYQYLLIRKAVSKSGYSVANSFNHSILKNRITMMSKSKSPLSRGWRVLYLLPLVCLGIGLQARTVFVPNDKDSERIGDSLMAEQSGPLYIVRQWGEDKEVTKAEFDQIDPSRFESIEILKDSVAKEKYGERGANGVIIVTLKRPQELQEIVVIRYGDDNDDKPIPFVLANPETMPKFQGEDMMSFSRWLNSRIAVPRSCKHSGTMKVSFTVGADGMVKDVQVRESVCEELDALVVSLIQKSPKWEPATHKGNPVAQYLTLPIIFQMR